MSYAPTALANEFLRLPEVQAQGGLTQMQLQKLVYMAHGWNMVINGEPLANEDPQAWTYGPVFPSLYDHTKGMGTQAIKDPITSDQSRFARLFGAGEPPETYQADLTPREKGVIESVWKRYGKLSGIRLSEMTHQPNAPWFKAYEPGRNASITPDLIRPHYEELLQRAEATAAAS